MSMSLAFASGDIFADGFADETITGQYKTGEEEVEALEGPEREEFERLIDLLDIDDAGNNNLRKLAEATVVAPPPQSTADIPNITRIRERLLASDESAPRRSSNQDSSLYATPRSPALRGIDGSDSPMSPLILPARDLSSSPTTADRIGRGSFHVPSNLASTSQVEAQNPSPGAAVGRGGEIETTIPHLQTDESFVALAQVQRQVTELRNRLAELVPLVRAVVPEQLQARLDARLQVEPIPIYPEQSEQLEITKAENPPAATFVPGVIPDEIEQMSEDEAKSSLAVLLSALSLPHAALHDLSQSPSSNALYAIRGTSEIRRALSFVIRMDELVWRRSMYPRRLDAESIFGEENIQAITDRIELWERVARAR